MFARAIMEQHCRRTDNAIGNLRTAAQNGLARGYWLSQQIGVISHRQVPVSYLGFAVVQPMELPG
jgi:hypothetical protein